MPAMCICNFILVWIARRNYLLPAAMLAIMALAAGGIAAQALHCDTLTSQHIYTIKNTTTASGLYPVYDGLGNFYITGQTFSQHALRAFVTKVNGKGTPEWTKNFGSGRGETIQDASADGNNGLVIAGDTRSSEPSGEGWLCRIDAAGKIVWTITSNTTASVFQKVLPLTDGGIAAVGIRFLDYRLDQFGNLLGSRPHLLVTVINKDGSFRWQSDFSSSDIMDRPTALAQTAAGRILVAAVAAAGSYTSYILSIDQVTGDVESTHHYKDVDILHIVELPDHSFRTSGPGNECWLDSSLNMYVNKQYLFSQSFYNPPELFSLSINPSNKTETAYYTADYRLGRALIPHVIKVTGQAKVEWARGYPFSSDSGATQWAKAQMLDDQRLFICGTFFFFQSKDDANVVSQQSFSLLTDKNGRTPCSNDLPVTLTVKDLANTGYNNVAPKQVRYIKNFVAGVAANDQVPVDIIDCYQTNCCRDTATYNTVTLCEGKTYQVPGGPLVDTSGIFTARVSLPSGCDSLSYTEVIYKKNLQFDFGNDTCLLNNAPIDYRFSLDDPTVKFLWPDGSTDSSFRISKPGVYRVSVTGLCNTVTDSLKVYETCSLPVYLPNAFSPNGDGVNDYFRVARLNGQPLLSVTIYDRFGMQVFNSTDKAAAWDGRYHGNPQPVGTYVCIVRYRDLTGRVQTLRSDITLVR